jgi:single-stranded DNA-binding protein
MASISVVGKVVCKEGTPAVALKTFGNDGKIANFSVVDNEYFYVKEGEERFGQFYSVEVNGKAAEIFAERLQRGDRVGVHGQLVQRQYQDKVYLTIKNARVVAQEPRRDDGKGDLPF